MRPGVLVIAITLLAAVAAAQAPKPTQPRRAPKPAIAADPKAITADQDEPGCKDSPLLARVTGCVILQCGAKPEDTVELITATDADGDPAKAEIDGSSENTYYLCPAKVTHLEIVKAAEAALVKEGYRIAFVSIAGDDPVVSGQKGDQWIQVATYTYDSKAAYLQTALKAAPEELVSAEALEEQFSKTDRVILSGLKFEQSKADLPASTEKLLGEIAAVISKKVEWKIRVEARASDAPDTTANQALSEQRATTVANWLGTHGIEKERITAAGHGSTGLVPETTQRIELVKH